MFVEKACTLLVEWMNPGRQSKSLNCIDLPAGRKNKKPATDYFRIGRDRERIRQILEIVLITTAPNPECQPRLAQDCC